MRGYLIVHLLIKFLNRHIRMIKNHSCSAKVTLPVINNPFKCSVFRVGFNPKAFAFKNSTAYFAIHLSHLRMFFTTIKCSGYVAAMTNRINGNPTDYMIMVEKTLCTMIIFLAILKSALRHSNPYP